jgi:hypothetical protein
LRRGRSTLVVCKSAGSCVCWRGRSSDELEFRPHTYIPHLLILQTPTEQTHQDEMTRSSSTAHPYKHAKPTKQSNPTIRASSVEYHYPSSQTSQHPLPLPPPPRKYEIHLSPNPFHFSLALSFTLSVVPSRRLRYTHNVVCLFLVLNVQKFASRLRVFSSALVWRRCLDGLGFGSADEEMFGESVLGGAGDELGGG